VDYSGFAIVYQADTLIGKPEFLPPNIDTRVETEQYLTFCF